MTRATALVFGDQARRGAFAEWISINHGDKGIRVSCRCPQGVNTPMLDSVKEADPALQALFADATIEPADVAEACPEPMIMTPASTCCG